MRLQRNLLASPINTALAAPPIAQLVGSSVSLIEAAVHVVNANAVAVPPEKNINNNKSFGFYQTVCSHQVSINVPPGDTNIASTGTYWAL